MDGDDVSIFGRLMFFKTYVEWCQVSTQSKKFENCDVQIPNFVNLTTDYFSNLTQSVVSLGYLIHLEIIIGFNQIQIIDPNL